MRLSLIVALLLSVSNYIHENQAQDARNETSTRQHNSVIERYLFHARTIYEHDGSNEQSSPYDASSDTLYRIYLGATIIGVLGAWIGIGFLYHQMKAANKAERAWVLVTIEDEERGNYGIYEVTLTNHGRTPARIIEAYGDLIKVTPPDDLSQFAQRDILPAAQKLLAPQETWRIHAFGTNAETPDLGSAYQEFFCGHVAYKILSDDKPHYTRFCYYLRVTGKWQVGGPPAYNDYS
jgi:hypothetical protein